MCCLVGEPCFYGYLLVVAGYGGYVCVGVVLVCVDVYCAVVGFGFCCDVV